MKKIILCTLLACFAVFNVGVCRAADPSDNYFVQLHSSYNIAEQQYSYALIEFEELKRKNSLPDADVKRIENLAKEIDGIFSEPCFNKYFVDYDDNCESTVGLKVALLAGKNSKLRS